MITDELWGIYFKRDRHATGPVLPAGIEMLFQTDGGLRWELRFGGRRSGSAAGNGNGAASQALKRYVWITHGILRHERRGGHVRQ